MQNCIAWQVDINNMDKPSSSQKMKAAHTILYGMIPHKTVILTVTSFQQCNQKCCNLQHYTDFMLERMNFTLWVRTVGTLHIQFSFSEHVITRLVNAAGFKFTVTGQIGQLES